MIEENKEFTRISYAEERIADRIEYLLTKPKGERLIKQTCRAYEKVQGIIVDFTGSIARGADTGKLSDIIVTGEFDSDLLMEMARACPDYQFSELCKKVIQYSIAEKMIPQIERIASAKRVDDPAAMKRYVNRTGLTLEKPGGPVERMVDELSKNER